MTMIWMSRRLAAVVGLCFVASAVFAQTPTVPMPFEPKVGQPGKDVVWVPTPDALEELTKRPAPWDLLFLNEAEAVRAAESVENAPAALAEVAPEIVVTLGARGAMGAFHGAWFEVPATPTEIHDATGAGDAFAAMSRA